MKVNDEALRIYLNDHLAASVGAIGSVAHCLDRNPSGTLHTFLQGFIREVKEEQAILKDMLVRIEAAENPVKQGIAWVAEKAHRLKPNDDLLHYTALSRLEALEALGTAVSGKRMLWEGFAATCADDPRFADIDFRAYVARSTKQLGNIEKHRLAAVRLAFLPSPADTKQSP